jgi:hypothetical protein
MPGRIPVSWEKTMSEVLTRSQAIEKISELIKDIRIAMLSTVTPEGSITSRPMATQDAEFKGELLFRPGKNQARRMISLFSHRPPSTTWIARIIALFVFPDAPR